MKIMHVHSDNDSCVQYLRNYVVLETDSAPTTTGPATKSLYPYATIKDDQCCSCYFFGPCPTKEVPDDDTPDEHTSLV